jgi:tRNA pseudouridine38-40 synthase
MRTLKLTIAYDGTAYAGWQLQPERPTVQGTLENAVAKVTGRHVRILASGRTDAGVHAFGQVVGFRTDSALPPEVLLRAINANLPHDVAVLDVADVPGGFHPIADVARKRYGYVIHDGPVRDVFHRHFAWHYIYGRLDADAMSRAAAPLLGKHDFSSFESSGAERKTSVRTVFELAVERARAGQGVHEGLGIRDQGLEGRGQESDGTAQESGRGSGSNAPRRRSWGTSDPDCHDFITIEIEADGFLYNMVRAIVGTLVEVGRGSRPENWPAEVLNSLDRRLAGPTAPPQGLCLIRVQYKHLANSP